MPPLASLRTAGQRQKRYNESLMELSIPLVSCHEIPGHGLVSTHVYSTESSAHGKIFPPNDPALSIEAYDLRPPPLPRLGAPRRVATVPPDDAATGVTPPPGHGVTPPPGDPATLPPGHGHPMTRPRSPAVTRPRGPAVTRPRGARHLPSGRWGGTFNSPGGNSPCRPAGFP